MYCIRRNCSYQKIIFIYIQRKFRKYFLRDNYVNHCICHSWSPYRYMINSIFTDNDVEHHLLFDISCALTFKNIISYIFCSCFPPFIPVDVSVDVKSLFPTLLRRQIQNQKKLQALINKGLEACYADDRVPDVRWTSARHRPERQRRP